MEKGRYLRTKFQKIQGYNFPQFQVIFTGDSSNWWPFLLILQPILPGKNLFSRILRNHLQRGSYISPFSPFLFCFVLFSAQYILCSSICKKQSEDEQYTLILKVVLPEEWARGHLCQNHLACLLRCTHKSSYLLNQNSQELGLRIYIFNKFLCGFYACKLLLTV